MKRTIFKLAMALFALAMVTSPLLCGCSLLKRPPDKYVPGENFGDGGATRCGTRTTVEADLKPCR